MKIRTSNPVDYKLSPRQLEILGLLLKGMSNQEIADVLQVSFYTVTSHLKNIYRKLGVRRRSSVVAKVLTEGLLDFAVTAQSGRSSMPEGVFPDPMTIRGRRRAVRLLPKVGKRRPRPY